MNSVGDPMPYYPLTIECGDGSLSYLTDREGRVHLPGLVSGRTMTVADGQNPAISEVYTLDFTQRQYIFHLPYEPTDDKGDVTLRVIELSGNPAADVTCILSQNGKRLAATLDSLGEMHFGSDYFENEKDIEVDLYTPRRTFPHLKFAFNTEEKEYELREVDGPTPWWKVAGEIALALGGIFLLFGFYHFTKGFLVSMPYIFG